MELLKFYDEGKDAYIKIFEEKVVLEKISVMFNAGEMVDVEPKVSETGIDNEITYISGVLSRAEDELKLKRTIFRVSRGRAFAAFFNFPEEPNKNLGKQHTKKLFLIFLQGGIEGILKMKVMNVLKLFNCHILFKIKFINDRQLMVFF